MFFGEFSAVTGSKLFDWEPDSPLVEAPPEQEAIHCVRTHVVIHSARPGRSASVGIRPEYNHSVLAVLKNAIDSMFSPTMGR